MDPSYQTVVDTADLVWTLVAYGVHAVSFAAQAGLSGFLLISGAHALLRPEGASSWLRRLGVTASAETTRLRLGALRVTLGLVLLAPIALGVSAAWSFVALLSAITLLALTERRLSDEERSRGRGARRIVITCAIGATAFVAWEREDNLALGADLLTNAAEWRNEELSWQLETDPAAPKVGDLAPDFELQDPEGQVRVRLSDFRGKRPVALVFGSYT